MTTKLFRRIDSKIYNYFFRDLIGLPPIIPFNCGGDMILEADHVNDKKNVIETTEVLWPNTRP